MSSLLLLLVVTCSHLSYFRDSLLQEECRIHFSSYRFTENRPLPCASRLWPSSPKRMKQAQKKTWIRKLQREKSSWKSTAKVRPTTPWDSHTFFPCLAKKRDMHWNDSIIFQLELRCPLPKFVILLCVINLLIPLFQLTICSVLSFFFFETIFLNANFWVITLMLVCYISFNCSSFNCSCHLCLFIIVFKCIC